MRARTLILCLLVLALSAGSAFAKAEQDVRASGSAAVRPLPPMPADGAGTRYYAELDLPRMEASLLVPAEPDGEYVLGVADQVLHCVYYVHYEPATGGARVYVERPRKYYPDSVVAEYEKEGVQPGGRHDTVGRMSPPAAPHKVYDPAGGTRWVLDDFAGEAYGVTVEVLDQGGHYLGMEEAVTVHIEDVMDECDYYVYLNRERGTVRMEARRAKPLL